MSAYNSSSYNYSSYNYTPYTTATLQTTTVHCDNLQFPQQKWLLWRSGNLGSKYSTHIANFVVKFAQYGLPALRFLWPHRPVLYWVKIPVVDMICSKGKSYIAKLHHIMRSSTETTYIESLSSTPDWASPCRLLQYSKLDQAFHLIFSGRSTQKVYVPKSVILTSTFHFFHLSSV